jgi:lipoprotein-anchoring transpeptidase ErfK/SrfK
MRTPRTAAIVITATIVAIVVALPTGVGLAAYYHDQARLKKLPSHSLVGNVDVSGLDRAQAVSRVRAAVDTQLDRKATLMVDGSAYTTSLRELGVRDDVETAVDEALNSSRHGSWVSRTWHRIFGGQSHPSAKVQLTKPAESKLQSVVDRAAKAVNVDPVDASVSLAGSGLSFTSAKTGYRLDKAAALKELKASLSDGVTRTAQTKVVQPKVTDSAFDTVIVVHINENKLYLYKNHTLSRTFPVATGTSRYPTPTGKYSVTLKRYMPTWYNPHSEWSRGEPETIGPGPHNPLGLRALNVSAPGIRIHGSPADYSIGYNASHGCIRMHNSDVLQLYPLVPTGTTVFLEQVGPYHPMSAKVVKKAPVVAAEGG